MSAVVVILLFVAPFAVLGAVVALLIVQIGNGTGGQRR
jgi:hypothetical protein